MRSLLLILIFAPLIAVASPLPDFPFVYVGGVAHRDAIPDNATISFQVTSFDVDAEKAYKKQAEVADTVLTFANKLGIPLGDIVAQAIEKAAVRTRDEANKEFEIKGYSATRSVKIQVKNLALFPKLIDFLYSQSNIERIEANFGCKDEAAILQGLTDEACKQAQGNAERLSKGFQRKLGSIRAISEEGFTGIGDAFGLAGGTRGGFLSACLSAPGPGRDFRVIPATIPFQKTVFAIFAIE